MDWNAVGAIGEIVGAAAVVGTLGYLAVQIRQNTRTTRATTYDTVLDQWRVHLRENYTTHPENLEIFRRGLTDHSALSAAEWARLLFLLSQEQLFIENIVQQHERGYIDAGQLNGWLNYFSSVLRTPGGREWWRLCTPIINPEFTARMQVHLATTADQPTLLEALPAFHFDGGE